MDLFSLDACVLLYFSRSSLIIVPYENSINFIYASTVNPLVGTQQKIVDSCLHAHMLIRNIGLGEQSRANLFIIETRLRTWRPRIQVRLPAETKIFLFSTVFRSALRQIESYIQYVQERGFWLAVRFHLVQNLKMVDTYFHSPIHL
jgi:hypothetical protein